MRDTYLERPTIAKKEIMKAIDRPGQPRTKEDFGTVSNPVVK